MSQLFSIKRRKGGLRVTEENKPGHDWNNVEALVRRSSNEVAQHPPADLPLAGVEQRIEVIKTERVGILGKFKSGSISRKAALTEMQVLSDAHLEATRHALKRALEVDQQRIDLIAQKYIYQITEEHLRDMQEMGLRNFESRMKTLLRLNTEAAALLKQAEAQDVPSFIKQKAIDAIVSKFDEFYRNITADEINLGK
jgi:hypothetical protein